MTAQQLIKLAKMATQMLEFACSEAQAIRAMKGADRDEFEAELTRYQNANLSLVATLTSYLGQRP